MQRGALISAVGLYIGGNTVGGAGGRLLGGFIAVHVSLDAVFLIIGASSLLCTLVVLLLLPPARGFRAQALSLSATLPSSAGHLGSRSLLPAYLVGGLNFMVFIHVFTFVSFRLSGEPWQLGASSLRMLFVAYVAGTFSSSL